MVNIIDILLVIGECYLVTETVKSANKAYKAYLDANSLIPITNLEGSFGQLHPVKDGKDCGVVGETPEGKGYPGLDGKFLLSMRLIARDKTITQFCWRFTPVYTHSAEPGNIWQSWNDPEGDNAGGYATGIGAWNVQQDVPGAPVYYYTPKGILTLVEFNYKY